MGAQAGEASAFPSGAPGGFDPARPLADPAAAFAQREHIVRQKIVKVETAKILRDRVQQCYRTEGVNHYQNCREHVNAYLECVKDVGISRINWTNMS